MISPDPLFISEFESPEIKLTPKLINLLPVGFVVIPEKLCEIAPEKKDCFPSILFAPICDSN